MTGIEVSQGEAAMSTRALHRPELSARDNVEENMDRRITEGRWHVLLDLS